MTDAWLDYQPDVALAVAGPGHPQPPSFPAPLREGPREVEVRGVTLII